MSLDTASLRYWAERARRGDAAEEAFRCRGCQRPVEHVAQGAEAGCEVCVAFVEWVWLGDDAEDEA